jgi:hypothetical protein
MAMIIYPQVQRKAQEELDAITGGTRLPGNMNCNIVGTPTNSYLETRPLIHPALQDSDDLDSLPYLTALCKEILRWQPVLPLGKSADFDCHNMLTYDKLSYTLLSQMTNIRDTISPKAPSSLATHGLFYELTSITC